MQIATTMTSTSQMPQALAAIAQEDEAGGIQGNTAQSRLFGRLFDQWAGMAAGERLPADSGNSKISQSPLSDGSHAERTADGAQGNDPSRGVFPRVTDFFTAGLFTIAMARPDKNVQKLPELTAADSGASGTEMGANSTAGATPGENCAAASTAPPLFSGWPQRIWKSGNPGGITTDSPGEARPKVALNAQIQSESDSALMTSLGLPVQPAADGNSSAPPQADNPREASEEKGGTELVWNPLFAVVNMSGEVASATIPPESAGPVKLPGNAQAENNAAESVTQPGNLLQATAGNFFQDPALSLPVKAGDSLSSPSGASVLKGGEPGHDSIPGVETLSGSFGRATGSVVKTGENAAVPQARGDIRASRDIMSSRTKGIISEAVDNTTPEAGVSDRETEPAGRIQGRMNSEAAGNAYRAAAADAVLSGRGEVSSMPGNIIQGKPPANQEQSAGTGIDLSRMEIVFSAAERENPKAPEGAVTRKSGEGKTADNTSTAALAANQVELRTTGESKITAQAPDAKNPLGEQITSQIREKLDAMGHGSDKGHITLKLHPDELGELKINMRMEDQHLKIEITTQNPSVKEALMQNLDTLKETLSRQNIAMDRFDVSADLRQGLHQGGGDGKQMTQESRLINTGFRPDAAIEDEAAPNPQYSWQNEDSLVNLVL